MQETTFRGNTYQKKMFPILLLPFSETGISFLDEYILCFQSNFHLKIALPSKDVQRQPQQLYLYVEWLQKIEMYSYT